MNRLRPTLVALIVLGLVACGSSGGDVADPITTSPAEAALAGQLDELGAAVDTWRTADSIAVARVAAETAANLVVGPNGPGYGDRNDDGTVSGETDAGILPGLDGTPDGVATALATNACVESDVLGGSWDDPAGRWAEMEQAIDTWRPDSNTMPSLASHPMRVVGWGTFTLDTDPAAPDALDLAHEYAGHAALHVVISADALTC